MAALVEFPIMVTSLGTIPNRCLSVTNRQPPGHEALTASGRDAPHSLRVSRRGRKASWLKLETALLGRGCLGRALHFGGHNSPNVSIPASGIPVRRGVDGNRHSDHCELGIVRGNDYRADRRNW